MNKKQSSAISVIFGLVIILIGFTVGLFNFILDFLGNYLLFLQILFIISGVLLILAGSLVEKNLILAKKLIIIGSILGILTIFCLIALKGLRDLDENEQQLFEKNHILLLPIFAGYFAFILFIANLEDRTHVSLNWLGRNGLTFIQTFWDTDIFWGEFWFNLMLILLFSAFLLIKFPISNKINNRNKVKFMNNIKISGIISFLILITMIFTWNPWFNVIDNWFETQFAYQFLSWIILIGFTGFFIFNIKTKNSEREKRSLDVSFLFIVSFIGIFIYLTSITNFHPHVVFNIELPFHFVIFTICFPLAYITKYAQNYRNSYLTQNNKEVDIKQINKKSLLWIIPIGIGFSIFIIQQLLIVSKPINESFLFPLIGYDSMFSMEMFWWWPLSHWPNWVFICSTTIFIFNTFKLKIILKKQDSQEVELNSNNLKNSRIIKHFI